MALCWPSSSPVSPPLGQPSFAKDRSDCYLSDPTNLPLFDHLGIHQVLRDPYHRCRPTATPTLRGSRIPMSRRLQDRFPIGRLTIGKQGRLRRLRCPTPGRSSNHLGVRLWHPLSSHQTHQQLTLGVRAIGIPIITFFAGIIIGRQMRLFSPHRTTSHQTGSPGDEAGVSADHAVGY